MAASYGGCYIVNNADMRSILFPVSGAGANVPAGTILIPGTTGGTNYGVLIPCTATSVADSLGVLEELHNFSLQGDATTAGTVAQWFPQAGFAGSSYTPGAAVSPLSTLPSHQVGLLDTFVAVKMDYNQASTLAVASATSTVLTITSEVANLDTEFVYVNAGTGKGQLGFIKSTASGSATLTSALTTTLDNTSKLTRISPLFWPFQTLLVNTTTVPTQIDTVVGLSSGGATFAPLANFMSQNGLTTRLDPKLSHNLQGLTNVSQLNFYSYLAFQDSIFHPGS